MILNLQMVHLSHKWFKSRHSLYILATSHFGLLNLAQNFCLKNKQNKESQTKLNQNIKCIIISLISPSTPWFRSGLNQDQTLYEPLAHIALDLEVRQQEYEIKPSQRQVES